MAKEHDVNYTRTPGDTSTRVQTQSVGVIIPCWNSDKWIGRAIQSALDQNYRNLDLIVIDDGSTDNSLHVIESFAPRIRYETGPNRGAPAARNRGLALTDAEFVLFLDADDYLQPGSLSAWVACSRHTDVTLGPCQYDPGPLIEFHTPDPQTIIYDWLSNRCVGPCSVLWRRSYLVSIGAWDEALMKNQDGELLVRALIDGARVGVSSEGCGVYVQHDELQRISKRRGAEVIKQQIEVFRSLRARAAQKGVSIDDAFARVYYKTAMSALAAGHDHLGQLALDEARRLGLRGHIGSRTHKFLAAILGLRNKVYLRAAIQRLSRL